MNRELKNMILQQNWVSLNGPMSSCTTIHPNTSCHHEVIVKMSKVMKSSFKMYAVMHSILFFLKLKKFKRQKRLKEGIKRTLKNFVGSLFFMSWLTGGMKSSLCFLNRFGFFLDWRAAIVLSLVGSSSIYFEDNSRRGEIGYFVVVRSIRSAYILLKKRSSISLTNEKQLSFMLIFGLMALMFFDGPKNLKNRYFLQKLWGDS